MLSLRDALDEAITKQLFRDMPRAKTEGEFVICKPDTAVAIDVDQLVNAVLAVIRDNAA